MSVQIGCAQCGKKYRVDEKFLGKKIRCKNCQAAIRVEGEVAAAAPVKAKVAAPVVKKAVASKPRGPQPEALDLPDLSDLEGLADRPTIQLEEREPEAARAPGCPSCGAAFPAGNRVCLNCGYNRASGQRARTVVAQGPQRGEAPEHMSRVGFDGTRLWTPYANPVLNLLDTSIPKIAFLLFIALGLVLIVWPIVLAAQSPKGVPAGQAAAWTVMILVIMGLLYGVVVQITTFGVKLAGKVMKFEVPPDSASRVMGIQMVATAAAVGIFILGVLMGTALHAASPQAAMAALGGTTLLSLVVYLALGFGCFILLFHLKAVEAILGFLLTWVFNIIGWVVVVVVTLVMLIIIGFMFGGMVHH